ncbi:von Willebrand factor type A domain-containing protein [Actinomadura meyerae]|uniref:von Willebrand factor type A domain-containing protein n=1 Tax=Actinomadura meyerae TaxID=240840 RepID=A0A239GPD6_9ACTN|nr:substrate-binding and VWA domain-containing protein [Actinomadura meyerae]SNS69954.1 von Willebrand factor type A domain-containing protein [Actinomadura meyerae]
MSGAHRGRPRGGRRARRGRRLRWAAAVTGAALAAVLGTSVYAVSEVQGCSGPAVTVDVAVAPEIAGAVSAAGAAFNRTGHRSGGRCVRAAVRAAGPAGVAALLAGQIPDGAGVRRPDVWVPDSSLWLRTLDRPPAARPSVARSPLVAAVPRADAGRVTGSWDDLLGTAVPGSRESRAFRLSIADPARTGAGMASLLIVHARYRTAAGAFAAFARDVRQSVARDAAGQFAALAGRGAGRVPVLLTSEQAVWAYNRARPAGGAPAEAVYPRGGTLSLDYPVALVGGGPAARLVEHALRTGRAREAFRAHGFRDPDGAAPAAFAGTAGVGASRQTELPAPAASEVREVAQAWARLALGSRMLSLIDVSGSMARRVPGTRLTRLQAIAQASQQGLALQPDDTELGQWVFSTRMAGDRDWRVTVPMGPLGGRIGSATRRQRVLSTLAGLRPQPGGGTGLYDTVLAAVRHMRRTYRPEMVNTVLVFTDGRNEDPGGPSLRATLAALRADRDPARPVQIIVIGFGPDVDTAELRELADATGGTVYTAHVPQDILRIFGQATARRLCAPDC